MPENQWDSYAPKYDDEPDHGLTDPLIQQKWSNLILSKLPPRPVNIIDMGGGTGSITQILAAAGHKVTYVDSSVEMTRLAMEKCRRFGDDIQYFTSSVENLGAEILAMRFDVVFGRHILWAVSDLEKTLENWHALLVDEGYFVFVEGFWSTGSGITASVLKEAVEKEIGVSQVFLLPDPLYWGKPIDDERYLIISK